MIARNIRKFAAQSEGDRIREQLALDPQSVDILNDYTAWYEAGRGSVDEFLRQKAFP
jgi:hypothetical protein